MDDLHIVYAVGSVKENMNKRPKWRVSNFSDWHSAIAFWDALDNLKRRNNGAIEINGWPVHFFVVRASDDPDWPALSKVHTFDWIAA